MLDEQSRVRFEVTPTLERSEVPCFVAGSFASNAHGFYRATADADLGADLKLRQIESFAEALRGEFYLVVEAIREALTRRTCFNVIHLTPAPPGRGTLTQCAPNGTAVQAAPWGAKD